MTLTQSDGNTLSATNLAPDFSLGGTDGKVYTPADFSQYEALLVIFMCNHCPFVLAKIDEMKKLHEEFGDRVAIIGINSNDPNYPGEGLKNMKMFAREHKLPFPYLFDETQQVARAYGATCTPDPFLFNKERKLVFHGKLTNAMNPDDMLTERTMYKNIKVLLGSDVIETWFDPSLGCSIKWQS